MAIVENSKVVTALYGHTSEETAYLIADYPYGWELRCQKKVWIEFKKNKGYRLVSRTTNPRKGNMWNKPDQSTYSKLAGNLYLNEEGHCKYTALSGWETPAVLAQFLQDFPENPEKELIGKLLAHRQKREEAANL